MADWGVRLQTYIDSIGLSINFVDFSMQKTAMNGDHPLRNDHLFIAVF